MTTNYLIWSLLKPSHLLLWLACLAILFRRRLFGRWCATGLAAALLLFGLMPTAHWLMQPLENRYPLPDALPAADGIIVLAGSEHAGLSALHRQPQLSSMGDRLTTALMLAAQYPDARLVHSGKRESASARQLLLGAGLEPRRLAFEDAARDTCDSAPLVRDLVAPQPGQTWLLVTSSFHLPRAMACFEAVDWAVIPYPADYRTGSRALNLDLVENLENLDLAAHEWLGLAYYRLRGRTRAVLPGRDTRAGD